MGGAQLSSRRFAYGLLVVYVLCFVALFHFSRAADASAGSSTGPTEKAWYWYLVGAAAAGSAVFTWCVIDQPGGPAGRCGEE